MGLSVCAAREPFGSIVHACCALGIGAGPAFAGPNPVAVYADDKAALVAHPVDVEEGGVTHIAHFTHALHGSLPGHVSCWSKDTQIIHSFSETKLEASCVFLCKGKHLSEVLLRPSASLLGC